MGMSETTRKKLEVIQKTFEDNAIRFDTSYECGRTITSTKSAATMCNNIAFLVKTLKELE